MRIESLVSIRVVSRPFLKRGIKSTIPVLIEIRTAQLPQVEGETRERNPFNLAVVLDKSGSMQGLPLRNSKKAIQRIIQTMFGPEDTLHLVTYDDESQVVFRNGNCEMRELLFRHVEEIATGGCTNMMAGMEQAREILNEGVLGKQLPAEVVESEETQTDASEGGVEETPPSTTATEEEGMGEEEEVEEEENASSSCCHPKKPVMAARRMFVFTDGLINRGVTDRTQIGATVQKMHEEGINVTAFGLGTSFDEDLLRLIANDGGGDYLFIAGADEIEPKVAAGMQILHTLVGRNARLNVCGVNGAVVSKVLGTHYVQDQTTLLGEGIPVGDMCENDVKSVLCELEISVPGRSEEEEAGEEEDSAEAYMTFVFSFEGGVTEPGVEATRIEMTGRLEIKLTDSVEEAGMGDSDLDVALAICRSGEADQEIVGLIGRRQIDEAIALKEKSIAELVRVQEFDSAGLVQFVLARARESLTKLKSKKQLETVQRDFSYSSYQSSQSSLHFYL